MADKNLSGSNAAISNKLSPDQLDQLCERLKAVFYASAAIHELAIDAECNGGAHVITAIQATARANTYDLGRIINMLDDTHGFSETEELSGLFRVNSNGRSNH